MTTNKLYRALLWRVVVVTTALFLVFGFGLYALNTLGFRYEPVTEEAKVRWIYLKPSVIYATLAIIYFGADRWMDRNLIRIAWGNRLALSAPAWRKLITLLSAILGALAVMNVAIAVTVPLQGYLLYKLFGAPFIFLLALWPICRNLPDSSEANPE